VREWGCGVKGTGIFGEEIDLAMTFGNVVEGLKVEFGFSCVHKSSDFLRGFAHFVSVMLSHVIDFYQNLTQNVAVEIFDLMMRDVSHQEKKIVVGEVLYAGWACGLVNLSRTC
jgi:hypothetical protein